MDSIYFKIAVLLHHRLSRYVSGLMSPFRQSADQDERRYSGMTERGEIAASLADSLLAMTVVRSDKAVKNVIETDMFL